LNLFQDIPVLRRRFLRFAFVPSALLLTAAVVHYIRSEDTLTLLLTAAAAGLSVFWCAWSWRRLRQQARDTLIKTRGLTCTACGYSLVGMAENGECPECGQSYYADHLTQCWSKAAGFPPPGP
jgi:uncharacterized paraquat-inducible protein A